MVPLNAHGKPAPFPHCWTLPQWTAGTSAEARGEENLISLNDMKMYLQVS
jgi:hypothetical protein